MGRGLGGSGPVFLLLSLFAVAVNIPFLNQVFHMDDGIYLLIAENIPHHPWFPQDRPVYFEGLYGSDLASTEHPWPLTSYLVALCAAFGGLSERPLHSVFLVFPVAIACSTYSIARRLTRHAVLASLTVVTLPAVYVMSHVLMTDVPLLAMWLTATALFIRGLSSGKSGWAWLAAATAAGAALVSYSGFVLVALLAAYGILRGHRAAAAIMLAVPAGAVGLRLGVEYLHYHRFVPASLLSAYIFPKRVLSPGLLLQKSIYIILALGSLSVFPVLLVALGKKKAILAGILMSIAIVLTGEPAQYNLLQKAVFVLFFCAGVSAITEAVHGLVRAPTVLTGNRESSTDDLFLSLWFGAVIVFGAVVYMTGSARYILPALPPLILILFRRLEGLQQPAKLRRIALANLVLSGSTALLLSAADYQFAAIYRDFASELNRSTSHKAGGLWFTGEWGFRAYLERLGGRELGRRDARPVPGDLLVTPSLATPYQTLFGDKLSLDSIAMVAPSRVVFDVPPLPRDGSLVYTLGMPFYERSDGMDFAVRFIAQGEDRVLEQGRLRPEEGRRWRIHEIPLAGISDRAGSIEFAASVGPSGNADADWLALARARIRVRKGREETVLYDFREHLPDAHVQSIPGVQYHTSREIPVFALTVWLEQEPASVLLARRDYSPSLPIRLLDRRSHAGFWSSNWGLLPFSVADRGAVLESISVLRVTRQVDSYGESPLSWYQH